MKKKMISLALIALLVLSGTAMAFASEPDYSQWDSHAGYPKDVQGTQWLTYVKFLMDKKIVTGSTDGLFHPENNITRAEFATMLARATSKSNATSFEELAKQDIFTDLSGYGWAKGYINAVSKSGLMNGTGGDNFSPGSNITYAEVITALIRISPGAASTAEGMASKWPDNYISYAETYNMEGDVVIHDWNAAATKGDVAKLLYRRLPK